MDTHLDIRPSPIAGQWYPGEKNRLAESVDGFLQAAGQAALDGEIVAIMVPHAGHVYSGPVAGYAFAALRGLLPELVAVVSPMHYPYFQAILTSAHTHYATPLGNVRIDQEAVKTLDEHVKRELGFGLAQIKNDPEHSLEIELPFLQRALKGSFKLLPVMVRDQSVLVARPLGAALAKTLSGRHALLVASTDLSHFENQATANALDAEMLRCVEAFDPAGVIRVEEEGKGFACGRGALAAVMWAAKELGANHIQVLRHATSGDVTGDFDRVVGYGAAVMLRRKKVQENEKPL
jgi:AmmeMemoRadiSam system protein B